MMNPKETLNHLLHRYPDPEGSAGKGKKDTLSSPYSVDSENLAVPEVHTKDYDEAMKKREAEQNASVKKEDMVFETLAIPEIHFKK